MPSLAAAHPEVTDFEAAVERVADRRVVLTETYFYPEGGGQPADRGTIAGVDVVDVQQGDDGVVHELATDPDPDLAAGETVAASVDESFRTYCRRAHTASHLLYGAGRRLLEDLGYGGFGITESKVRVDFTTTTDVDDDLLVDLERRVNEAVWDSREVSWERLPREEALGRDDVAFNTKTEEGITGDTVRVVTVEGWDVAACGGTHVRNTREIGPVSVLDRSNPGEGSTRVEFAVGPDAIERRATDHANARAAARALDTRIESLADAVDRVLDERESLETEVSTLQDRLIEARLSELRDSVVTRDGQAWLVGALPGVDANDLADVARDLAGSDADVAVLADADGQYLAVASECALDAGELVDRATEAFGGGGGGSPTVAQAGGLDAPVEDLLALYESGE